MAGEHGELAFAELGGPHLVRQLHQHLDELMADRDQLEQLLRVIVEIGSDLDLDATLHRIVTAAMGRTGSRYAALAIHGPDARILSFSHAGMDADSVQKIGHLPVGKGILGIALEPDEVLCLDDLTTHPAALGFPPHHPPMRALLGVPITIRGEVFGTLYVANDDSGRVFIESDKFAARTLASAAAVAIDNAQRIARVRASTACIAASREITTALLSDADPPPGALQLIAECAMRLTDAEQAIILVPTSDGSGDDVDTLVVSTAVGVHADEVIGQRVPVDGSMTGAVFGSGTPVITESFRHPILAFTDVGQRSAIVMPLRAGDSVVGVIAVARSADAAPFGPGDLDSVSDFAGQAAVALTLAAGRDQERELSIRADRTRIAYDLHDHVIQRLFVAGLNLQGAMACSRSPAVTHHLTGIVDDLRSIMDDIRTAIFELQHAPVPAKHLCGGFGA